MSLDTKDKLTVTVTVIYFTVAGIWVSCNKS